MKINRSPLKKIGYIAASIFLAVLLALLLLGLVEIILLDWFLADVQPTYLGIGWGGWLTIRIVSSPIVILLSGLIGFRYGRKNWQMIYGKGTTDG